MRRPRAFALLYALTAMFMAGGLAIVFTSHLASWYRRAHLDALAVQARQLVDSGLAYAGLHRQDWLVIAPTEPIKLPTRSLLSKGTSGKLALTVTPNPRGLHICVASEARRGRYHKKDRWEADWTASRPEGRLPSN